MIVPWTRGIGYVGNQPVALAGDVSGAGAFAAVASETSGQGTAISVVAGSGLDEMFRRVPIWRGYTEGQGGVVAPMAQVNGRGEASDTQTQQEEAWALGIEDALLFEAA